MKDFIGNTGKLGLMIFSKCFSVFPIFIYIHMCYYVIMLRCYDVTMSLLGEG